MQMIAQALNTGITEGRILFLSVVMVLKLTHLCMEWESDEQ